MNPPLQADPPHPYARSFVVKLTRDADPAGGRLAGRIEHLQTGLRREFADAHGLLAALNGLFAAAQAEAADPPAGR